MGRHAFRDGTTYASRHQRASRRPAARAGSAAIVGAYRLDFGRSHTVYFFRRSTRPATLVLLPVLLILPVLLSIGEWDSALAGFLAIGITVLGRLMFGRRWPPYLLLGAAVALILLLAPDPCTGFGITFGVFCLTALLL